MTRGLSSVTISCMLSARALLFSTSRHLPCARFWLLTAFVAVACIQQASAIETCSSIAAHLKPEQSWLEETSTQGGRALPSIHDPLLGYTDWPEDENGIPQKVFDKQLFLNHSCTTWQLSRFKWYNGTLWTDANHINQNRRRHLVEMLLISKWLYKDLPDMDILFNYEDQALNCTHEIPMLQHTALDAKSRITGQPFDINLSHLVFSLTGRENSTVNYTHGYTIPYNDAWQDLSLSRGQLQVYSACLQETYGNGVPTSATPRQSSDPQGNVPEGQESKDPWAAARTPRAVWRGSTTGYYKGWLTGASTQLDMYSNPLLTAFWNKRLYMCAMARPYPWLDFAVTRFHPQWMMSDQKKEAVQEVLKYLEPLVSRPHISLEAQSGYQLALSIDGNGAPWRLPRQLLGLTPIMKVDSPYQEFFAKRLQPKVHFEPLKYDLTDLAATAKHLLDEAAVDSTRLQRMAVAAQEVAVQHLNALGQLDSFVWSLLKLKAAYAWQTEAPESEPQVKWRPVVLQPDEWYSPALMHIRQTIEQAFPNNFNTTGPPSTAFLSRPRKHHATVIKKCHREGNTCSSV